MTVLLSERQGEILVLTLNRPEKGNALDEALQEALVAQLEAAARHESVRGVVLASAGSRTFCAGADLKQFAELDPAEASGRRRALLVRTLEALVDFPKPLVAAVQAKALGAGAMLAFLADAVLAAETAEFGMPEIRHGMPSPIGIAIIEARGGRAAARQLVQGGEPIAAAQARLLGLVDEVVAPADLPEKSMQAARRLGEALASAYAINKRFMNARLRAELEEARRFIDAA